MSEHLEIRPGSEALGPFLFEGAYLVHSRTLGEAALKLSRITREAFGQSERAVAGSVVLVGTAGAAKALMVERLAEHLYGPAKGQHYRRVNMAASARLENQEKGPSLEQAVAALSEGGILFLEEIGKASPTALLAIPDLVRSGRILSEGGSSSLSGVLVVATCSFEAKLAKLWGPALAFGATVDFGTVSEDVRATVLDATTAELRQMLDGAGKKALRILDDLTERLVALPAGERMAALRAALAKPVKRTKTAAEELVLHA